MSTEHNFDRGLGAGNDKLQLVVTGTWIRTILISVLNIMNITNQYIETCCMLLISERDMESNYVSHMWKFVADSHLDVIVVCKDGSVKTNLCFAAYFEEIIKSVIYDAAEENDIYLIMPDYTVEEVSKITRRYSVVVISSNSSEVTETVVEVSPQDHNYQSKSNVSVSPSNCNGLLDSNAKITSKNLHSNLKEFFNSKVTKAKYEKICDFCGKIFYNSLKFAQHNYRSHAIKNNTLKCQNPNCFETFANKHLFDLHVKRKHTNSNVICSLCGKSFKRSDVMFKHVRNVHKSNK